VLDLARPREPFALYQRRGTGQLLFDMGITGDFIGNLTQDNVQKATGGTFSGLKNYAFPREIELNLFGQIDPYARAEVRIEAGQEQRGGDVPVSLAEVTISLMTLPFGTQAKLGQMRNRFGLTNEIHEHDLPFIDRPTSWSSSSARTASSKRAQSSRGSPRCRSFSRCWAASSTATTRLRSAGRASSTSS
jgi:hypothetical protein